MVIDENKYKQPRKYDIKMMTGRLIRVHCTNGYTTGVLVNVDEWGITVDRGIKIDKEGDTVVASIPWTGIRYVSWDSPRYKT